MFQAGRDFGRPVVQPPACSRVNSEVRPGCSGLHPVRSWKHPAMETAQSPWAGCAAAWLSSWGKSVSSQGKCSAPNILVTLCWTCCSFLTSFSLSPKSPSFFSAEPLPSQPVPNLCCWKSYSFPFVLIEIHRVSVSPVLLDGIPALKPISCSPCPPPPPNLALSANLTGVCSNTLHRWSLIKVFKRASPRTRPLYYPLSTTIQSGFCPFSFPPIQAVTS